MKGVNKIVEEILLIAIVILLVIALFFILNNFNAKTSPQLGAIHIENCIIKNNTIELTVRNILDQKFDGLVIQVWDNNLQKPLGETTVSLDPNKLLIVKIESNETLNNTNLHVEFLNYRIKPLDISCEIQK